MKDIQLRYIFDRKKESNNTDKTGLLQIEARIKGTNNRILLSTGIKIYKNQFSKSNGFTCKNRPNSVEITSRVRKMFNQIELFAMSDKCTCLNDIKNWNNPTDSNASVIEFMNSELIRMNPTGSTYETHIVLIRRLKEFGKIQKFDDLTYSNICDFDQFLRKTINSSATLNKRHTTFKSYIVKAIYRDLCKKNPYMEFKMPPKKSKDPVFLDESEIDKIIKYDPINEKLQKVKDLFIFQIFTGMAFIDLQNFSKEDYIGEMDGVKIISNERKKTGEPFISVLLPQAEEIAEKYNYSIPKISNQKYNDYLKLLGAGAGLKKNLTSHVARHTFATYLINKDVPLNTVSKAVGHSSIKMTEHYAKLLGKTVVNDMRRLLVEKQDDK